MSAAVRPLTGAALQAALPDLARLRITVFAAWPYLYAGSEEYERHYLAEFTAAPDAVLVAAYDGERIVGAATASPLIAQDSYIREPFMAAGIDPAGIFYFGESVLLPDYRGQGIGHAFFDHREAAAQVVIVHRRQIVVDERIGVDALNGAGERQGVLFGTAARGCSRQHTLNCGAWAQRFSHRSRDRASRFERVRGEQRGRGERVDHIGSSACVSSMARSKRATSASKAPFATS